MIIKTRCHYTSEWNEMQWNELQKGDIIDMNEKEERWEGDSLNTFLLVMDVCIILKIIYYLMYLTHAIMSINGLSFPTMTNKVNILNTISIYEAAVQYHATVR